VITPTGSITMKNASGALSGILQLISDNIVVTDQALATKLAADSKLRRGGTRRFKRTADRRTRPDSCRQAGSSFSRERTSSSRTQEPPPSFRV
jgi:hypothetical protein